MNIINMMVLLSMGVVNFTPINNYFKNNLTITDSSSTDNVCEDSESKRIWGQNKIELYKALKLSNPIKTIKVGVLDSGIDYNHDALKTIHSNLSYNYINNSSFPTIEDISKEGHGTHVAGIIASMTNYSNIELISYRVMDMDGKGNYKNKIDAIDRAIKDDVDILNISSSGFDDYFTSIVPLLTNAIKNFNGLVICSAGNDNLNLDNSSNENKKYPACIETDNVITVGATTYDDSKLDVSNYGKTSVDLFAPGEDIYSTVTNNLIASYTGTSMSAPMVTGVAALLLSNNPSLSTSELKNIILNSVDKIDSLEDKCVTGGRLNAHKALMKIHQHSYNYKSNDNGHTYECICGEVKSSSNHSYKVSYDTTTHTYKCVCGETKSYQHSYTFGYIDSKCHGEICTCGYYKNAEAHIIKQGSIVNNKAICLGCKTTLDLNYDMGITPLYDIVYITSNGSYKLPNGIIVLSDEDYNSYINGTLSFNYNDMLLS